MPLSKENRHLLEVAIIGYLRFGVGEATSRDIYHELKSNGFLAVKGIKQVSMICSSFERKGALLSRVIKVKEKLRTYKKKLWRVNPNFYEERPNQSMFSYSERFSEVRSIKKRRMKRVKKRRKYSLGLIN